MSDDLHRQLMGSSKGPVFRKVKKHEGKSYTPKKHKALTEPGLWCASCQTNHAYKSKKTLGAAYERRNGVNYIQWYCIKSGNVLKEEGLPNGKK